MSTIEIRSTGEVLSDHFEIGKIEFSCAYPPDFVTSWKAHDEYDLAAKRLFGAEERVEELELKLEHVARVLLRSLDKIVARSETELAAKSAIKRIAKELEV